MPIVDKDKLPTWLQHPKLIGVFVNGCVSKGDGSRFRAKVHAHITGEYQGWLCYLSEKRLGIKELDLHELAHIVCEDGHTDKWRQTLINLGGTLDAVWINGKEILKSYHKKGKNASK